MYEPNYQGGSIEGNCDILESVEFKVLNTFEIDYMDKLEKELIYIYLRFPHDFYTISTQYYYKLKDWRYESFLNKFIKKIEYTKEKEILVNYLNEKINN